MSASVGSLCMGYGGLDLALEDVFGARTVWCSEIESYACSVIRQRFPQVVNHGDLKLIDWAEVEPVDIITAGYPCQPFSHAGLRKGTDDPRHLWPYICDALRFLRPRLAVFENVAGHLSLGFDTVLADLAAIGFDADWIVVRASDVGACHRRERLFVLAADAERVEGGERHGVDLLGRRAGEAEQARLGGGAAADPSGERHGRRQDGRSLGRLDGEDAGEALQRERAWALAGDRGGEAHADADSGGCQVRSGRELTDGHVRRGANGRGAGDLWGAYGPAIERHARAVGRPAPAPVDDLGRLSHHFVEWMQMLPEGWVCRVEHMKRNPALRLLGNGVVPPQAAYALRLLLEREAVAA